MSLSPEETPIPDEMGAIRRTIEALEGEALDAYLQTLSDKQFYAWMQEGDNGLAFGGL